MHFCCWNKQDGRIGGSWIKSSSQKYKWTNIHKQDAFWKSQNLGVWLKHVLWSTKNKKIYFRKIREVSSLRPYHPSPGQQNATPRVIFWVYDFSSGEKRTRSRHSASPAFRGHSLEAYFYLGEYWDNWKTRYLLDHGTQSGTLPNHKE